MKTAFLPGLNRLPTDLLGYDANKAGMTFPAKTRGQRKRTTISIDPVTNTVTIKMSVGEAMNLVNMAAQCAIVSHSPKACKKYQAMFSTICRKHFGR